jgi:hypothetical protein
MRCAGLFVVGLGALMVCLLSPDFAKADFTVDGSIFNATFPGDTISATDWPTAYANGSGSVGVAGNALSIQGAVDYVAFVDSKTFAIPDPTKYAVQVDFNASSVFATNAGGGHEWELVSGYAGAGGSGGKAGIDLCLYGPANQEQTQYNLCWNRDESNVIATLQLGQSYSVVAARDGNNVDVYVDGNFFKRVTPLDGTPVCLEMGDGYQSVNGAVQYTHVAVGAAVPEPSCVVLLATAGLALVAYAWRKRKA